MNVAEFLTEAKGLALDERVELTYSLWDEIMAGFPGWTPSTKPSADPAHQAPWEKIKTRIDAELGKSDRFGLAQELWSDISACGYDPEPTPEQLAELERRAEEALRNPQSGVSWETVRDEARKRFGWK